MTPSRPCPKCNILVTPHISPCPNCGTRLKWQLVYNPEIDLTAPVKLPYTVKPTTKPTSSIPQSSGTSVAAVTSSAVARNKGPWDKLLQRRLFLKTVLSALAGAIWYALKPSEKPIIIGSDRSTKIDNSVNIMTVNIGPLIQCQFYIGTGTISYSQSYPIRGQKNINYGVHLLDSMVQWKQGYDNELNQGILNEVWSKVIIAPVQEKIKSAHAVICLGVADDLGETRQKEESLASRRAANLEQVATLIRGSDNRVHSLNLGQWLKHECEKRLDWDNQRRIIFITVDNKDDPSNTSGYGRHVRDAAEQLRAGIKDRSRLEGNEELDQMLTDNETLIDAYLNCYSRSKDWVII